MFLDEPNFCDESSSEIKHKISLKVPSKLWEDMRDKAKKYYTGRGKYSQLVNDALEHFINFSELQSIDWDNPDEDDSFMELVTQIRLGANMKDLNPNPIQVYIRDDLMMQLVDLEASIKGARKLLSLHIKPAVIRRAVGRWMFADFPFIQKMKQERVLSTRGQNDVT